MNPWKNIVLRQINVILETILAIFLRTPSSPHSHHWKTHYDAQTQSDPPHCLLYNKPTVPKNVCNPSHLNLLKDTT
jgi:hypothetical protein